MRTFILITAALLLSGCAQKGDGLYLKPTAFDRLPGWHADNVAEALPPLEKSCALALKKDPAASFGAGGLAGTAGEWRDVCSALPHDNAHAWFENNFTPYQVLGSEGPEGLFTGYYEPVLNGARKKKAPYLYPLYGRPDSLVTADLGLFKEELKGKTVTGRVDMTKDGAKFVPYFTRAEIEKGALKKEKKEIVWVDSAIDAFYLQIQGSGIVRMKDGGILRAGYAAQNGLPYTAIGRELIKRGALTKDNVSMQSIRAWLEAHPKDAEDVMNVNASYVFFRKLDGDGPLGAQGVALTPSRSMAVDSKKIPYGAPLFIDAEHPGGEGNRLQRLMIAQDTGGAIKGAVRGDFFWGASPDAAEMAGKMKSKGFDYILLPKTVKVPKDKTWHFWNGLLGTGAVTPAQKPEYNK